MSAIRHALLLVVVAVACGGKDPPAEAPPPPPDDDDWFTTPTDQGPASLPPREGAHPCPKDRCWTEDSDGKPAACVLPGGPVGRAGDPANWTSGVCGSGGEKCVYCECAAADTPVATPTGEVAIADLAIGDLVMSVHEGALRPVPVIAVSRRAVREHTMVTVTLDDGRRVSMSPGHPTADGGVFGELVIGASLGDARISAVTREPYAGAFTHDILPASDTGTYLAAGALVGSTLFRPDN